MSICRRISVVVALLAGIVGALSISTPAHAVSVYNWDLSVSIDFLPGPRPTAGEPTTVALTVSNAGPLDAIPGSFAVGLLAASGSDVDVTLLRPTWTCRALGTSTCSESYVPHDFFADAPAVSAQPGASSVTYFVRLQIPDDAVAFLLEAIVVYPEGYQDHSIANDTAELGFFIEPDADLEATVDNGRTTLVPGVPTAYTAVVTNHGPDDAHGVAVNDVALATADSWTCTPGPGASCTAAGLGDFSDVADIPAGSSVTYLLLVTPPAGSIDFLYAVGVDPGTTTDDRDLSNNLARDYDFVPAPPGSADTSVVVDNHVDRVLGDEVVTYTMVVSNAGPADVAGTFGATFTPALPGSTSWTCQASGTATCAASGLGETPNPPQPIPTEVFTDPTAALPAGTSLTYTVTTAFDPSFDNHTTVPALFFPSGTPLAGNRSDDFPTDSDPLVPVTDLGVTVSNGTTAVEPGAPVTYSVVVTNAGPHAATDIGLSNLLPAALAPGTTWTCTPSAGATCTPSGEGDLEQYGVTIPPNGSLTYTVTGTVEPTASGELVSQADVMLPPVGLPVIVGLHDPVLQNNSAEDVDTILASNLTAALTAPAEVPTAGMMTYQLSMTNAGAARATTATATMPLPPGTTFVSMVQGSGPVATLATPAVGAVGMVEAAVPTLLAGEAASFSVTVALDPAIAQDTMVSAAASVTTATHESDSTDNVASTSTAVKGRADLSLTMALDGPLVAGAPATYLLQIANAGPDSATGQLAVVDVLPAGLSFVSGGRISFAAADGSSWSCSITAATVTCTSDTDLPSGATTTLALVAAVDPSATGEITNSARLTVGEIDPDDSDRTASLSAPVAVPATTSTSSTSTSTTPTSPADTTPTSDPTADPTSDPGGPGSPSSQPPAPTMPAIGALPATGARPGDATRWAALTLAAGVAAITVARRRRPARRTGVSRTGV